MKHLLTITAIFIGFAACAQKHDTVQTTVHIRQVTDTVKVILYYNGSGGNVKWANGFLVRLLELDSRNPGQPKLISGSYFDDKFRLFDKSKTIMNVIQR